MRPGSGGTAPDRSSLLLPASTRITVGMRVPSAILALEVCRFALRSRASEPAPWIALGEGRPCSGGPYLDPSFALAFPGWGDVAGHIAPPGPDEDDRAFAASLGKHKNVLHRYLGIAAPSSGTTGPQRLLPLHGAGPMCARKVPLRQTTSADAPSRRCHHVR